ncbi:MAG: hypothetical protein QFX32_06835 [Methanolinea sp.]|nr:hypothetical protein [Methanolinea sp.]
MDGQGQRTLSIGVTVNLENYENLRLEVSGPVETEEDAMDLARFLDSILRKFGQGDEASRERVDSFRRRILPRQEGVVATEPPLSRAETTDSQPKESPQVPENAAKPAAAAPAAEKRETEELHACEACGAPVKPADRKMSMLFASRTLCRKCLRNV